MTEGIKKPSRAYSAVYMAIVTAVFVSLVSAVAIATRPRIELNEQVMTKRELVKITGTWDRTRYPDVYQVPAEEISKLYDERIGDPVIKNGMPIYYARDEAGKIVSIAFPIEGPGFWGPIHGFLAIDPASHAIQGITFDKQNETPGLGGEIAKPWFQEQFVGKVISPSKAGRPVIELVKNAQEKKPNQVDAITGASNTSYKVQGFLTASIDRFFTSGGDVLPGGD